eukprot:276803_1
MSPFVLITNKHRILGQTILHMKRFNHSTAIEAIKKMYQQKNANTKLVKHAVHIYENTKEKKCNGLINTMLKLLIFTKKYDYINLMWNDITLIERKNTISCPIIIKCFVLQSKNEIDIITKCIQILNWMNEGK